MTTKQILDEMEKEFDEKFVRPDGEIDEYADDVKSFIHSFSRKLIESLAEEMMAVAVAEEDECPIVFNVLRWQRLKVKEIINSLEK